MPSHIPRGFLGCLLLLSLALGLTTCATPGTSSLNYQEPKQETFKNETIVNKQFSDTWDVLVKELAKSFFVINNVEKASRIINVSFSTEKPEGYVDCGHSERRFEYGDESTTFKYAIAESNHYKVADSWGPYNNLPAVFYLARKASLDGRVNIYVAPKDNVTIVTANVRYIFTVRTSGQAHQMNAFGAVLQMVAIPESSSTVSFNTNQVGSADWGTPQQAILVKCRSTGLLESQILGMASQ